MSYGVTAVLLVRLDERIGQWETVAALADHFGLTPDCVREHLEQLAADDLVRVRRMGFPGDIVSAMVELTTENSAVGTCA